MKQYLEQFFKEYEWPEEAGKAVLGFCEKFWQNKRLGRLLEKDMEIYGQNVEADCTAMGTELVAEAEKEGLNPWETWQLFYLCLSRQLPVHYQQRGLSQKVCRESLFDLKWKAMECRKVYGVWGNFTQDWFAGFLRMERFTLGRLQFEIMKEAPSGCPKEWKALGRPFVNVHIPEAGPLKHEACEQAYRQAEEFWEEKLHLSNPIFFCDSWLLFPGHRKMLPPESNIRRFQDDYALYETYEDKEGHDLWRIFGKLYDGNPETLPENTSLQKAYKKWLLEGRVPGAGRGILGKKRSLRADFSACGGSP
mgnify:FL=1